MLSPVSSSRWWNLRACFRDVGDTVAVEKFFVVVEALPLRPPRPRRVSSTGGVRIGASVEDERRSRSDGDKELGLNMPVFAVTVSFVNEGASVTSRMSEIRERRDLRAGAGDATTVSLDEELGVMSASDRSGDRRS